jgi:replicative DNA helicase
MNNPTQTLPQALDAERGLIGSMLLAPDRVISEFVERGSDEFFHHPAHQTIYRHMLQMWTNRKGVNLITLTQSLEDLGLLEGVGGAAYVTELFNFVQTATGAKYYADKATRGLKPGEMITIAAPTKGGKSALALNIGMHNGLAGIPVGIFSLEMSADELTDRLIAAHGNVDMCAMTDGGFSQRDITSLTVRRLNFRTLRSSSETKLSCHPSSSAQRLES